MPDPYVREIGRIEDMDGIPVSVCVDYDAIRLEVGSSVVMLAQAQAEEFGHLFVSACWQAARQVPGD